MTRTTETALDTVDQTAKSDPTSRTKNLRRIGVGVVAVAMVMPLTLPAFAAQDASQQEPGFAASAVDAQAITATSTAGSPEQEAARQELSATTPAELAALQAQLQAELDAQAAAEAEAEAEAEAAAQAEVAGQQAAGTPAGGAAAATPQSAPVSVGAGGGAIASAALAQVGETQTCTQLVADSLAAVGIPYTGMGNLFNLGPTIPASSATPGDIIYYSNGGVGIAHVAVYIGGGQAVHGGWNGNQTVVSGANLPGASAPVFIDVG